MAEITASLVKELRERTGLGMMECKKALTEAGGDIEVAIDNLRKSGATKAAKKAGNVAAEGAILVANSADGKTSLLLEVNSQTDFVAKDANFTQFANKVAQIALANSTTDVAAISALSYDEGVSVEEARVALVQKIGENIQIRRATLVQGDIVATYVHSAKIGVAVALTGGDTDLGRDVAMHIAASNPMVVNPADVPADILAREKEIYAAKARESGKPDNIVEKMIEGSLKKYLAEVSLTEQAFVKDPDVTVGALLKKAGATLNSFTRLEVGEGIEKKEVDFAAEVAAQQAAAAAK
ncbi:translation elongation factor Ts [Agitococcus lubricus]|uniref:Elongation factor Ts n=1 Tax=Agitococcus lubricus TaxID=1077255 RepID=A0A2T5J052_9GAMM|nr:translation elongation factor Ts [Agitococcus lubricus]PTQ89714.1 translation elongation factor Ts (EF-Ts) [Agitococcus lubricus]